MGFNYLEALPGERVGLFLNVKFKTAKCKM
jgi:hypothetical protein